MYNRENEAYNYNMNKRDFLRKIQLTVQDLREHVMMDAIDAFPELVDDPLFKSIEEHLSQAEVEAEDAFLALE